MKHLSWRLLTFILLILTLMTGCGGAEDELTAIVTELLQSRLHVLLFKAVGWGLMSAVGGFFLGLFLFFIFRGMGLYTWEWKHSKWFRGLAGLIMALAGLGTLGMVGLMEGAYRGGEVVLRESQLATDVFPAMSEVGADLIGSLYIFADKKHSGGATDAMIEAELEGFRKGTWEVDVDELFARSARVSEDFAKDTVSKLRETFIGKRPDTKDGVIERLCVSVLTKMAQLLLQHKVKKTLKDKVFGIDRVFTRLFDKLPESAAKSGNPKTLSHKELSDHIVQHGIVPLILLPLHHIIRSQQMTMIFILLGISFGLFFLFWIAEKLRSKKAAPEKDEKEEKEEKEL